MGLGGMIIGDFCREGCNGCTCIFQDRMQDSVQSAAAYEPTASRQFPNIGHLSINHFATGGVRLCNHFCFTPKWNGIVMNQWAARRDLIR